MNGVVRSLTLLLAALAASGCVNAGGNPEPHAAAQPEKVLFVGNSLTYYNNGLHRHYRGLIGSANADGEYTGRARIVTISGGQLPEHAGTLPVVLSSEQWDVVVMQGHTLGPITEGTAEPFRQAARDYARQVRAAGAEPVFFMTWAYTDRPEMTAELDAAYSGIGEALDARVVPVGLAFADVSRDRPEIRLRTSDKRHPTLAGTYLAACMMVATLHGMSPEGLEYTAGLEPEVAAYLQQAAWATTRAYSQR